MLTTVLDQVGKARDNRLILSAFLPTLLLAAAVTAVYTHATGTTEQLLVWWDDRSGTIQFILAVAVTSGIYVVASVVLANTTRLIQFFEGISWNARSKRYGAAVHERLRARMTGGGYPRYLPDGPDGQLLPTGLGNALRTGERHATAAYDIQPVALWSRLATVIPEPDQKNLDSARTVLDFLVVVCAYAMAFTAFSSVFLAVHGSDIGPYAVAVGIGGAIAFIAYLGAEQAALALAVLIATAFDLHRHKVLQGLRLPLPTTPFEEQRLWRQVDRLIRRHDADPAWVYQDPPK